MIDEIRKEKQPLQKPQIPERDKVEETRVDMETRDKRDGGLVKHVKEDAVKVSRLNITDHEITPRESDRPKIHPMVIYLSCNFLKILFRPFIKCNFLKLLQILSY